MLTNKDIDRIARRAAVEAGYADLAEYIDIYQQLRKSERKKKMNIKLHLIRFAIGLLATAFILAVIAGLAMVLVYYSIWLFIGIAAVILIWTIYKTGKSIVESLYEDEEIWGTIVEDYNDVRRWVISRFRRG